MPWNTICRQFARLEPFRESVAMLRAEMDGLLLSGLPGAARVLAAAALVRALPGIRRVLVVTPGVDSARRVAGDLETIAGSDRTVFFPHTETLPGENLPPPPEITGRRLLALHALSGQVAPLLVVAPVQALLSPVIPPARLRGNTIELKTGLALDRGAFLADLFASGYERADMVSGPGEVAVRGGIVDFHPPSQPWPLRLELTGSRITSLRFFDPATQLSRERVDSATILPCAENGAGPGRSASLLDYLEPGEAAAGRSGRALVMFWEPEEIEVEAARFQRLLPPGNRPPAVFSAERIPHLFLRALGGPGDAEAPGFLPRSTREISFHGEGVSAWSLKTVAGPALWRNQPLHIFCRNESQGKRLAEVLAEHGLSLHPESSVETGFLSEGFSLPGAGLTVLTDSGIFGRYRVYRPALKAFFQSSAIADLNEIKPGDFVVHINEGIGRFLGIEKIDTGGRLEEVMRLEYDGGLILSLPVSQVNLVHRYAGAEKPPRLSKPGSRAWLRTRERARQSVRDLAADLVSIYQGRRSVRGFAFPADTPWQKEFEAEFFWEETPDQVRTIGEIKQDMTAPRAMDRLVCGDVGYGKTEVAMRAAFKAAEAGRQVALVCPTTILCQQHLHTFQERFADYPMTIENLSRFRSPAEQKRIIADLAAGRIDIIIGTHRLLGRDVKFRDLGLWIVDEEQRFGVVHKEKLRARWPVADILTMTATPIPRTLQLSLGGIRDLSVIETPPAGRQPVITFVSPYRDDLVRKACERELERDGQVFFVHNRVQNIALVAEKIAALVPDAEIAVCHGQMDERELAVVMERFLAQRVDILVATTIIESGLDIPNANTIIINNGQAFGLADLYQLRGRVGRYHNQAYCYLLYRPGDDLTEESRKRLRAIEEFQRLGSGFRLAMADLEIRGAGNLLGREQHGFIEEIGFYLYSQLFREAVAELTGRPLHRRPAADKVEGSLPDDYIPPEILRLSFYRRLFGLSEKTADLAREMADRFGPLPEETRKLLRCFRDTPPIID